MTYRQVIISRAELYKKVWSIPINQLCKLYNLSNNGLKKICLRYKIPVPPVGYWQRAEAGHKVIIPPLSPIPDKSMEEIVIQISEKKPKARFQDDIDAALSFDSEITNKVTLLPADAKFHPVVVRIKNKIIVSSLHRDYGVYSIKGEDVFEMRVSPANVDRALRIINTVLFALERRGAVVQKDGGELALVVNGQKVTCSIYETSKRSIRPLSSAEARKNAEYRARGLNVLVDDGPKYIYTPEGKLTFMTEGGACEDKPGEPLECQLNDILFYITRGSFLAKERRLEREARERESQDRADRKRREEENIKRLTSELEGFEMAQRIRRYLEEAEKVGTCDANWLAWIRSYSDRLDPLIRQH